MTMTVKGALNNPNMESEKPMDHWFCTLSMNGSHMGVHFSTGLGLRKAESEPMEYARWMASLGLNERTSNPHQLKARYSSYLDGRKYPVKPSLESVLDCLISDAASIVNSGLKFEDWCAEYGYDEDSRKAEKTFNACKEQAQALERFIGSDEDFTTLLFNTKRL